MKKLLKSTILAISLLIIFGFFAFTFQHAVFAEQSGSSPESGATSRIKTIYNSLVALSHGSESAGGWGDWGTYWNRIRSAAAWVPSGNATEADVASGKTFYKDSRTQIIGTAPAALDYSKQSLMDWEDMRNYGWGQYTPNGLGEDNTDEESTWLNTAGNADTGVWQDARTELFWTANQGYHNNLFTKSSCTYFTSIPRGSYAGVDANCGPVVVDGGITVSAINLCGQLELDADGDEVAETDWYLPSQKELLQAYIDGIFNKTSATFTNYKPYWSSTEPSSGTTNGIFVYLYYGGTGYDGKTYEGYGAVRCVRRD
ncbi:DUF1566 domain-containing protein [Candidatus Woesebacteria bacterium]|nr:DUF1566 domain-containing protein [Candidatus Woesebacteria bacterium]